MDNDDKNIEPIGEEPISEEKNKTKKLHKQNLVVEDMLEQSKTNKSDANNNKNSNSKNKFFSIVKKLSNRWFIKAFSGMAQGLFVTLIAGTIIKQIGKLFLLIQTPGGQSFGNALIFIGNLATILMGAGIGAGISKSLGGKNLTVFSGLVAGLIGAYAMKLIYGMPWQTLTETLFVNAIPGDPIGAYVCALIASEVGILIEGKTKIDIILVPLAVIFIAALSTYIAWPAIKLIEYIALGIEKATAVTPFLMGIIISVVMGILLTMPTSSAAIWISIATNNTSDTMLIAGGAAVVGCASHMIGFAVASFRENGVGGLIAQGIGTSMLQIPNIMKNPKTMIPAIVSSIIVGPLSTTVFKLRCGAAGGGMGTSGFVGVISTIENSVGVIPAWKIGVGITLLMFVIPAVVSFFVSELLRKYNWIKINDMKI